MSSILDITLPGHEPPESGKEFHNLPVPADIPEYEFNDSPREDADQNRNYAEMDEIPLLAEIMKDIVTLRDEQSKPYFFLHGTMHPAPSKHLENKVKYEYWKIKGRMPDNKLVREVFDVLASVAQFESPQVKLYNRVGSAPDCIVYDLCDKRHLIVTDKGWKTEEAKPLFRKYAHQQPQVEPVPGGDVWLLFRYIAVPKEQRLLIMVYIICLFVPDIPHPLLIMIGDKGAAKTFTSTTINQVVDPTITEKIIIQKNERDLIQTLKQKYLTVFDNASALSDRVCDILCQSSTGGGISYRQLYTNEGENIAQIKHAVIINSITPPIIRDDLLDRSIIMKLLRIDPQARKTEQELKVEFEKDKPHILGGIFDALSSAMAIYQYVELEVSPRLADFAKWGYAVAEALGESGDQFIEDYFRNVDTQNESVANNNVLCQSVLTLMAEQHSQCKSVAETHGDLKRIAGEDAKARTFPKLPHNLRNHLDQLKSTLLEYGISYEFSERDKNGVRITLRNSNISAASASPGTSNADSSQNLNHSDEPGVSV